MSTVFIDFSCGSYLLFEKREIKSILPNPNILKENLVNNQFTEINCITGPGSFTGLRTSCAFLNGFFWNQEIKIFTLCYKDIFFEVLDNNQIGLYFAEFKPPYVFLKINGEITDFIYTKQNKSILDIFLEKQDHKIKTLVLTNKNREFDHDFFNHNQQFSWEILEYDLEKFFRDNSNKIKTKEILAYQLTIEKKLNI